jgi:hypothetical protein
MPDRANHPSGPGISTVVHDPPEQFRVRVLAPRPPPDPDITWRVQLMILSISASPHFGHCISTVRSWFITRISKHSLHFMHLNS